MSLSTIQLVMGEARIDPHHRMFVYKQGPFIKGALPFDVIKGFFYESSGQYANFALYHEKDPGKLKRLNLTMATGEADEFLDTLRDAIGRPEVDLRGLSREDISQRLGIQVHSSTRITLIVLLIVFTVGALIAGGIFFKKANYLSHGPVVDATLKDLTQHPKKFDGKKVRVQGLVLPGRGKVTVRTRRRGGTTRSYSGYGGFVPEDWKPDQAIHIFVNATSKETAKHIASLEEPEKRTILGLFKAGAKPPSYLTKVYKKAGLTLDPKGVVEFPLKPFVWWALIGMTALIWLILVAVVLFVWRRSRTI